MKMKMNLDYSFTKYEYNMCVYFGPFLINNKQYMYPIYFGPNSLYSYYKDTMDG